MKNISKFKVEKSLLIPIILLCIISILTVFSATELLNEDLGNIYIKQTIWFIIGFIIAYLIMYIGNNFIYKNIFIFYILGIISLICLLLFADPINNTKAWFKIPLLGTIQPSEFMKIILIIMLAKIINEFNENNHNPTVFEEFKLLLKVFIIVLIPSILTFLQPDTGIVLIYFLITAIMLFIGGIRLRWFFFLFGLLAIIVSSILLIYYYNEELFINIFGNSFFYRINRLLDFKSTSGYQLENSMLAIGSGNFFGNGLLNTPIYFPESQNDFIFAVFSSNFGFIGSLLLISLLVFLNIKIISLALKTSSFTNKYVIAGVMGMLIYQQIQNISMTIGLLPITGITLPFISYGGSSILSYMLIMGIIFNISNDNLRYTN